MKVATSEQMHQIYMDAVTKYGIPEIVLMENAGSEVAKEAIKLFGDKKKYCIIAGYGNNGGDAFVTTRHLLNSGAKCKIFLLGNERRDRFSPSARINYNILESMGAEIYHMVSERDWNRLQIALTFSDAVIDGLLGTGMHGELSELALKCINQINEGKCPVLSIDIPSGLNANTGMLSPTAVKADITVTFGLPKIGMYMIKGRECTGKLVVKDIGIPMALLNSKDINVNAITEDFVREHMEPRPRDAHKGSCGKVLIIAGSIGYTGAGKLAAEGALRIGSGLVTLAVADSIYSITASSSLETIIQPLPEAASGILGLSAFEKIKSLSDKVDTVLIGPGLGQSEETAALVKKITEEINKPLVIDADGIKALKNSMGILADRKAVTVLTPHLGEFADFASESIENLRENLFTKGMNLAKLANSILVVKSEQTITFYPTGEIYINTSGNQGMATAGSGDVLAGAIVGLIAENKCKNVPAPVGVYIHGTAGDISAKAGVAGLIAGDIAKNLQRARGLIENV